MSDPLCSATDSLFSLSPCRPKRPATKPKTLFVQTSRPKQSGREQTGPAIFGGPLLGLAGCNHKEAESSNVKKEAKVAEILPRKKTEEPSIDKTMVSQSPKSKEITEMLQKFAKASEEIQALTKKAEENWKKQKEKGTEAIKKYEEIKEEVKPALEKLRKKTEKVEEQIEGQKKLSEELDQNIKKAMKAPGLLSVLNGDAYLSDHKPLKAIKEYDQAIKAMKRKKAQVEVNLNLLAKALGGKGVAFMTLGKFKEAKPVIKEALTLFKKQSNAERVNICQEMLDEIKKHEANEQEEASEVLPETEVIEQIKENLKALNSQDLSVRIKASEIIPELAGSTVSPKSKTKLFYLFKEALIDQNEWVRSSAVVGLGEVGKSNASSKLNFKIINSLIEKLLKDESETVQAGALGSLALNLENITRQGGLISQNLGNKINNLLIEAHEKDNIIVRAKAGMAMEALIKACPTLKN